MSIDINVILPIGQLLATRDYDTILSTSRHGEHMASFGEFTFGPQQYQIADAAGVDLKFRTLDGTPARDAALVLRGWLDRVRASDSYTTPAVSGLLQAKRRWFADGMVGLIALCEDNPDAILSCV